MYPLPALQAPLAVGGGAHLGRAGTPLCHLSCLSRGWERSCGPDGKELAGNIPARVWQPAASKHSLSAKHCNHDGCCCVHESPFLLDSCPICAFGLPPLLSSPLRV